MGLIQLLRPRTSQPQTAALPSGKYSRGLMSLVSFSSMTDVVKGTPLTVTATTSRSPTQSGVALSETDSAGVSTSLSGNAVDEVSFMVVGRAKTLYNNSGEANYIGLGLSYVGQVPYNSGNGIRSHLYFYPNYSGQSQLNVSGVMEAGKEYAMVVTYKRGVLHALYVNGALAGSDVPGDYAVQLDYHGNKIVKFGHSQQRSMGLLAAGVWNRALSSAEALALSHNPWEAFEPETRYIPLALPDLGPVDPVDAVRRIQTIHTSQPKGFVRAAPGWGTQVLLSSHLSAQMHDVVSGELGKNTSATGTLPVHQAALGGIAAKFARATGTGTYVKEAAPVTVGTKSFWALIHGAFVADYSSQEYALSNCPNSGDDGSSYWSFVTNHTGSGETSDGMSFRTYDGGASTWVGAAGQIVGSLPATWLFVRSGTTHQLWKEGKLVASLVATARYVTNGSKTVGVGKLGVKDDNPNAHILLAASGVGELTTDLRASLSKNPWQLFAPKNKYILRQGAALSGPISSDLEAAYSIRESVLRDVAASYSIRASVQRDQALSYAVRAGVLADVAASYGIQSGVFQDLAASYGISGAVAADLVAAYSIRTSVQADSGLSYAIRAEVLADAAASYSVRSSVLRDLIAAYGIAGSVTKDLSASYSVRESIVKDLDPGYLIRAEVARDLAAAYSIRAEAARDLAVAYSISGATSSDLEASYSIRAQVQSDAAISYSVMASVLRDLAASYGVRSETTRDLAASYAIRNGVSADQVVFYAVDSDVAPPPTVVWDGVTYVAVQDRISIVPSTPFVSVVSPETGLSYITPDMVWTQV